LSTLLLTQKRVGKGAQKTKKRKKNSTLTPRLAVVSSPTLPTLSSPPFSSSSVYIPATEIEVGSERVQNLQREREIETQKKKVKVAKRERANKAKRRNIKINDRARALTFP